MDTHTASDEQESSAMTKLKDELLRRPLYLYDLPPEVLSTLAPKPDTEESAIIEPPSSSSPPQKSPSATTDNLVGSQACSLCSLTFETLLDQRGHLKSDLHHYNLKQRLRGQTPVSEAEFEKLIGSLDESLSGSDSSDEEDEQDGRQDSTLSSLLKKQARLSEKRDNPDEGDDEISSRKNRGKAPLVWFECPLLPQNHYFGMYRAILTGEEQRNTDLVEVLRKKQLDPITFQLPSSNKAGTIPEQAYKGPHFFLCMIGGGHFAAMVVSLAPRSRKGATTMSREAVVLAHKTFHRYTTRRKQGGSQSANDNSKGTAHSAGSSLRRYNEQALVEDVRALLRDWKGLLDTSELLFIRATGTTNRKTLFGPYEGQVLRHNDTRLRGFPFSTRRATQNELMRSFIELTRLKIREIGPAREIAKESESKSTPTKASDSKPAKPKLTEEEETALLHTSQLQAFIRRSKLPAILSYLKNNELGPDFEFQPPEQNYHAPRPLHFAAAQNAAPLVVGLLVRGGADPTVRSKEGKTPFELAGDRSTRDAFRVARSELGEDKWPWDEAKVPSALTKATMEQREAREKQDAERKEAERRQAEEERLRTEGPVVKESAKKPRASALSKGLKKTPQERREAETRHLTPEMKRQVEREMRARAVEERLRRMKEEQNSSGA